MVDHIETVGELLKDGYEALKAVGIDSYAIDCELLLGKVISKDRLFMLLNRNYEIDAIKVEEYYKLLDLRKNRMPIKYILGECEFMGLSFYIKEGVLIPRPDTETLVEQAIEKIRENNFHSVCDVCCGSGAIGVSIANLTEKIEVSCCDISDIAYEVTKENIRRLVNDKNVRVIKSDLLNQLIEEDAKFDMVVSNPPYIRKDIIPTLMEDVKNYEPYIALCGGEDGLDFYRRITKQSLKVLNRGGMLIFEIGYDQKQAVSDILTEAGFEEIYSIKDLVGNDRVIQGKL